MSRNDLSRALWRKSSYSDGQANCVEVAVVGQRRGVVAVRDSKWPGWPGLTLTPGAWRQFTQRVTAAQQAVSSR
jgi:Domain of unknown function (DUF397)